MPSKISNSPSPIFTLEEVAKHCVSDDAWVAIAKKVYDITSFKHPGIRLQSFYGKDVTRKFSGLHDARQLAILDDKFFIGHLASK